MIRFQVSFLTLDEKRTRVWAIFATILKIDTILHACKQSICIYTIQITLVIHLLTLVSLYKRYISVTKLLAEKICNTVGIPDCKFITRYKKYCSRRMEIKIYSYIRIVIVWKCCFKVQLPSFCFTGRFYLILDCKMSAVSIPYSFNTFYNFP